MVSNWHDSIRGYFLTRYVTGEAAAEKEPYDNSLAALPCLKGHKIRDIYLYLHLPTKNNLPSFETFFSVSFVEGFLNTSRTL